MTPFVPCCLGLDLQDLQDSGSLGGSVAADPLDLRLGRIVSCWSEKQELAGQTNFSPILLWKTRGRQILAPYSCGRRWILFKN